MIIQSSCILVYLKLAKELHVDVSQSFRVNSACYMDRPLPLQLLASSAQTSAHDLVVNHVLNQRMISL